MRTSAAVADYVVHNHALGKKFRSQAVLLRAFTASIADAPLHKITAPMISTFVNRGDVRDITKRKRYRDLERFFRHQVSREHLKSSPMPITAWRRTQPPRSPYIYSKPELRRLIAAVPEVTGSGCHIDAETFRMFLILLYGAGLRCCEARNLTLDDVDLAQSLIHVRETKFFKSRLVPIGADLCSALTVFVRQRHGAATGERPVLFAKRDGSPLSASIVMITFRRLRRCAGIARPGDTRNQPRLHDLRHTAAVHRVICWYREGADLNDLLPKCRFR